MALALMTEQSLAPTSKAPHSIKFIGLLHLVQQRRLRQNLHPSQRTHWLDRQPARGDPTNNTIDWSVTVVVQ